MNLRKGRARVGAGVAAALSAALLLGACGGGADRSAAPVETEPASAEVTAEVDPGDSEDAVKQSSESITEVPDPAATPSESPDQELPRDNSTDDPGRVALRSSVATYVTVENRLTPWWAKDGLPITWRVTETQNRLWDGSSRPDHAPPKGLQGLVQDANSGQYEVRLEASNAYMADTTFVLTPVVAVDGQQIPLSPVTFTLVYGKLKWGYQYYGWEMRNADMHCRPLKEPADKTQTLTWTERTPGGLLSYDVVLTCQIDQPTQVLIRTSQRG